MSENKTLVVRVYGDSISMPRAAEGVLVEQSWPELLEDKLRELGFVHARVLNRSLGGALIKDVKALCDRDAFYFRGQTGVVVFRVGIVDCAPRPIPLWLRNIVALNPLNLGSRVIGFLHKYRSAILQKHYFQNTSIGVFSRLYRQMLERVISDGHSCICMGIGPVSAAMVAKSPGLTSEIRRYNEKIQRLVASVGGVYLSAEAIYHRGGGGDRDCFLEDGHHLSCEGNMIAAECVARLLFANKQRVKNA